MAALCLEMPDTVPRTEYSAQWHWELISKVTGITISDKSSPKECRSASDTFIRAWDYGFSWNVLTHGQIFKNMRTSMGHAAYMAGGKDYCDDIFTLIKDPDDVYNYDMYKAYGKKDNMTLTAQYDANYRAECARELDAVCMTGIYVTCMSGLIELLGWDILLLSAGNDIKAFGDFVNRYCAWIMQYFDALAMCESPVVMIHDDLVWSSGPFLHPEFYRKFIFPNYKKLFKPLQEAGKIILFTCDGNFNSFVDDIVMCGINGFILEPLTDMAYIAEKYGKTHVFVGNADTNVLLKGRKDDIKAEVKRCMDIGKKYPGFFLSVGNHIPANTPVDNVLYYDDVYRRMARR